MSFPIGDMYGSGGSQDTASGPTGAQPGPDTGGSGPDWGGPPSGSGDAGPPVSGGGNRGVGMGDNSTSASIVEQARGHREDYAYGDDRAIANPPNWAYQTSTELYRGATEANDPGSADEMGQAWSGNGTELQEVADGLYEAITELGGVWVGQASGAAQGALIGIANASSTAGDAALAMGQRMQEQSRAAAEVKKMPPPKEFDMEKALASGLAGGPAMLTTDYKDLKDEADAVKAEQQRYMDAYTKAMSDVDASTPDFGPESIGMRPVVGDYSGRGVAGGPGVVAVGNGGAQGVHVGGPQVGAPGTVEHGSGGWQGSTSGGGQYPGEIPQGPLEPAAEQGQQMAGSSPVSTSSSGAGIGAGLGLGALGAGAGVAGIRAMGKGSGKHAKKEGGEPPAAAQPQEMAQPQEAVQPQEPAQPATEVPADTAAAAAPPASAPVAEPQGPVAPPAAEPAVAAPQTPVGGEPQGGAPDQIADGAVTSAHQPGAGQPAPGQVAASTDYGAGATAGQGGGGAASSGQPLGHGAAGQHGMAPMTPMGGAGMGGAGMGGDGAAGGAAEHSSESYLIQPDPDDLFGPDEAMTSGVIGAFDDDEADAGQP